METNPSYYGLPIRTILIKLDNNRLGISKVIKSRIIGKDAEKITAIAQQIRSVLPNVELSLICTRNICSKSVALVKSEGIEIEYVIEK